MMILCFFDQFHFLRRWAREVLRTPTPLKVNTVNSLSDSGPVQIEDPLSRSRRIIIAIRTAYLGGGCFSYDDIYSE